MTSPVHRTPPSEEGWTVGEAMEIALALLPDGAVAEARVEGDVLRVDATVVARPPAQFIIANVSVGP